MKKQLLTIGLMLVIVNIFLLSCSSNEDGPTSSLPTVTTTVASQINQTTATSGGNVTADGGATISARGICWSTSQNPTTTSPKTVEVGTTGVFESSLTGLTANTQYYVRAYATNSVGTSYGTQINFTTTSIVIAPPVLTTSATSAITATTATSGGNVTSIGGAPITARGVCWSTTANPTTTNDKTTETGSTGIFTSAITGLAASTQYYVRAYATNSGGTAYGTQVSFTTVNATVALPSVTTTAISAITQTTASGGGNVTSIGGAPVTARGICWATTANPTTANNFVAATGTIGSFVSAISSLTASTQYYVRAYATNSAGTAYGTQVSFTTLAATSTGPTGGSAVCNGTQPTVVVPITSSTGKIWMDRNLGASRTANAKNDYQAYGCLYQWGRGNDGHASITYTMGQDDAWGVSAGTAVNGTTATRSTSDSPGNALFIKNESSLPYDWRNPKNDNLWQGAAGINNPCPAGYRVPTRTEFVAELSAYSITGGNSAYNSIHKFVLAGDRAFDSGSVRDQGVDATFWTSTVSGGESYNITVQAGAVYSNVANGRAGGYSVRCIKN